METKLKVQMELCMETACENVWHQSALETTREAIVLLLRKRLRYKYYISMLP